MHTKRHPSFLRRKLRKIKWTYRRKTWEKRALPNFLIIGAMKAGTSSLFEYLQQHPQLIPAFRKEIHFFDENEKYNRGLPWYRSHFPLHRKLPKGGMTYEATPRYLYHPEMAKRIYENLPEVKLIALLRNPTDRAISHYFHDLRYDGMEPQPMGQFLREKKGYKRRGLYRKQLTRYLNYFPPDQLLVLNSDSFFQHPDLAVKRIFNFLGVDSNVKINTNKQWHVTPNKFDIDPDLYHELNSYFKPHNQELYELVGEDYGWDKP